MSHRFASVVLFWFGLIEVASVSGADTWWSANDTARIKRSGTWEWTSHRYAVDSALATKEDGAALEFSAEGRAVVLGLDTLTPRNHFGPPELGALDIFVDGQKQRTIWPRIEDREVVLIRSDQNETHHLRIVHHRDNPGAGCRIRGVRIVAEPSGDLAFLIAAEHSDALTDVRAQLTQGGRLIRDTLVRNWLTGQGRLAAIPPGEHYTLEIRATGWTTARAEDIAVNAGAETQLPPIYLHRAWDVPADD